MSNIDKQALREAAEKATAGQWVVELGDEVYAVDGDDSEQIAMVFSDNGRSDAAFIAAASPTTMLALLDELEAEQRICSTWRKTAEANSEKLEAAENRIAELDARKVMLPTPYPKGYGLAADKYNFALEECADAIRAAGIGVKGE